MTSIDFYFNADDRLQVACREIAAHLGAYAPVRAAS